MAHFIRVIDSMTIYQRRDPSRGRRRHRRRLLHRRRRWPMLLHKRLRLEGAFFIQLTRSNRRNAEDSHTSHKRRRTIRKERG